MLEWIGADVAARGPRDAGARARGVERERACRAHAEVLEGERVFDALVGLDARELHAAGALALAHPRPLRAHAERRPGIGDAHLRIAPRPDAPLRPLLRLDHIVVDRARRGVDLDRALDRE